MSGVTRIKYGVQMNLEEKELEHEMETGELNLEEKEFTEDWSVFWKKRVEKENLQIFTYTFDNTSIKYDRNQNKRLDEFICILPSSGTMQHFYKDEKTNDVKINEFNLHHNPDSSDWKISYEIEELKSEKKNILSYECFKMNIKQTRINKKEGWEIINQYELFVTDKINLPVRLVIHLWEAVTELCALEIKTINMERPNSFAIQRAIEIEKEIDRDEIELPSDYANLLKEMNKQ